MVNLQKIHFCFPFSSLPSLIFQESHCSVFPVYPSGICVCTVKHMHISSTLFGEGNGTPLQYCCLENPMDGGAW